MRQTAEIHVQRDSLDGTWPPLVSNPRVATQVVGHAVFGAVLGALAGR